MHLFLLVFHLMVTLAMIGAILIQRSENSGVGLGGGTMGGMMTARGTANLLTRITAVLATLFISTNLLLAVLNSRESQRKVIQVEKSLPPAPTAPSTSPKP